MSPMYHLQVDNTSTDLDTISQGCAAQNADCKIQDDQCEVPAECKKEKDSKHSDGCNPLQWSRIGGKLLGSVRVCSTSSPLAQFAEQLTLNQSQSAKNSDTNALSPKGAGAGAAVGADSDSFEANWLT